MARFQPFQSPAKGPKGVFPKGAMLLSTRNRVRNNGLRYNIRYNRLCPPVFRPIEQGHVGSFRSVMRPLSPAARPLCLLLGAILRKRMTKRCFIVTEDFGHLAPGMPSRWRIGDACETPIS